MNFQLTLNNLIVQTEYCLQTTSRCQITKKWIACQCCGHLEWYCILDGVWNTINSTLGGNNCSVFFLKGTFVHGVIIYALCSSDMIRDNWLFFPSLSHDFLLATKAMQEYKFSSFAFSIPSILFN